MPEASGASRGGPLIAVLGYHKVGPHPIEWWTWFYVGEETFARQLEWLRTAGWEIIGLDRFLRGLEYPAALGERSAIITFDDGYRSLREGAFRRLRQLEAPAVVFVATDYIGGVNSFDQDVEPIEAMCDWGDLERLWRAGFSIQSHTASHAALSALSPERREEELVRSKAVLEARLSQRVTALSYPYGDDGGDRDSVDRLLSRTGYRAAFLYGGGAVTASAIDGFRIPRLAMGPDTDLARELRF
ncbi:MAG TPA: polysaccharide deacetylase family protein [Thermoleophilaceae bacterium]|nr:polysaccharide deacetylase family protein [Thermoleophilaceae bacterium]